MSKFTKLINNPKLFFQDMAKKRNLISNTEVIKPETVSKSTKKPAVKPVAKVTAKLAPPTVILDKINPFKKYIHAIHTGEGMTHGPSHLSQWIPYFCQADVEFVVIVRNMDLYKWVTENFPYVDVIYAKNPIDIENVLNNLAFLKAIYYLSNTGNLIHTLRYNVYQHIFLGHGDSDKSASAHKFFRVYDQVWVAGQAHIDRFKNAGFYTGHMQFIKVGRPTLSGVIQQTQADWINRLPFRALYLPTWEGVYEEGNYSSVRLSANILTELSNRFGMYVSAKFHPVTGSRDKMLANVDKHVVDVLTQSGANFHIASKLTPINELLINSNIFICDISAVVSECIAANGPIFVYIPKDKDIKIAQSDMTYEDYAYTFSTLDELYAQMEQVLSGNDYKYEKRLEAMEYLLGLTETKNNEFIKQLHSISNNVNNEENMREVIIQ